jgi:hypothetical protein
MTNKEYATPSWRRTALRMVAGANFTFVLIGLLRLRSAYFYDFPLAHRVVVFNGRASDFPYDVPVFRTMAAINVACLILLVIGSIYIWRRQPWGLKLCTTVFVVEIIYWAGQYVLNVVLARWISDKGLSLLASIAWVNALGNAGLSPQFRILYPLIAILAINFLYFTSKTEAGHSPVSGKS